MSEFIEVKYKVKDGYHTINNTYLGRINRIFAKNLPIIKKGIILDWGCSCGHTTYDLSRMYPNCEIIGIDLDESLIKDAKLNSCASFFVMDGFTRSFIDGSFDAVFCLNNIYYSLIHMKEELAISRLKTIGDLVKPHGFLAISGLFFDVNDNNYIILKKRRSGLFKEIKIDFQYDHDSQKRLEIIVSALTK